MDVRILFIIIVFELHSELKATVYKCVLLFRLARNKPSARNLCEEVVEWMRFQ